MSGTNRWEKTKSTSKAGFDWAWKQLDKLGAPVNRLSNKLGSEAFWPTDIGRESDKAARILRSFCKDGFYQDLEKEDPEVVKDGTQVVEIKGKQRVVKKIPQKVIERAVGLCIFTTMRTGLWISGAGGSGVLVARLPDGSWSPPSGVMLHTAGLGFLVGVDIYDCVIVINTPEALRAFENPRFTLGGDISAVVGPIGAGGILETEIHKRQTPVFNYIKSRGFYAGVQIDGTVIIERNDENAVFYGDKLSAKDILSGKAQNLKEAQTLMETIKAAEGKAHDENLLPSSDDVSPGDYTLTAPESQDTKVEPGFGVPKADDPDPFGVRALQETGLVIHEAGTGARPTQEEFEFHPSPTSPVYAKLPETSAPNSASIDGLMKLREDALGADSTDSAKDKSVGQRDGQGGDIGESGPDHVREAAELDAKQEIHRDELASPSVVEKPDPLVVVGKGMEDIDLGDTKAVSTTEPIEKTDETPATQIRPSSVEHGLEKSANNSVEHIENSTLEQVDEKVDEKAVDADVKDGSTEKVVTPEEPQDSIPVTKPEVKPSSSISARRAMFEQK